MQSPEEVALALRAELDLAHRRIAELEDALGAPVRQWCRVEVEQLDAAVWALRTHPGMTGHEVPREVAALDLRAWWTQRRDLPPPTRAARRWQWPGNAGRHRAQRLLYSYTSWAEPRSWVHVRDYLERLGPRMTPTLSGAELDQATR